MSDKKIKIVLIDNQKLFRQALKRILDSESIFEVVAEGNNVYEAKKLIQEKSPDIVLTEINIPGIKSISEECSSNARLIILSDHDDEYSVTQALKLGAQGYLLKEMDIDSLIEALKIVSDGSSYLHPKVTHIIVKEYQRLSGNNAASHLNKVGYHKQPLHLLTKRECEVLQLLANGKSNRELSEELGISQATVKIHVGNILLKMNCNDRTQAVVTAIRNGWVEINFSSDNYPQL